MLELLGDVLRLPVAKRSPRVPELLVEGLLRGDLRWKKRERDPWVLSVLIESLAVRALVHASPERLFQQTASSASGTPGTITELGQW
jgi:hypothetical protein